jgi:hypothetical protein
MSIEFSSHKLPLRLRISNRFWRLRAIWALRSINPFKWRGRYKGMREFERRAARAMFFGEEK